MIVGRIVSEDIVLVREMFGRTVKMSMEKLKRMVKHIGSEFRDLEERSHKGEKVRGCEMVELKMKLGILEKLLQEEVEAYQWYAEKLRKKVKCLVRELYKRNIRHNLIAWLKEEELTKFKHG